MLSGAGLLNDLWKFDMRQWIWISGSSSINQYGVYGTRGEASSGNVPGARRAAVGWKDNSGNLWLFGGHGYSAGRYGMMRNSLSPQKAIGRRFLPAGYSSNY